MYTVCRLLDVVATSSELASVKASKCTRFAHFDVSSAVTYTYSGLRPGFLGCPFSASNILSLPFPHGIATITLRVLLNAKTCAKLASDYRTSARICTGGPTRVTFPPVQRRCVGTAGRGRDIMLPLRLPAECNEDARRANSSSSLIALYECPTTCEAITSCSAGCYPRLISMKRSNGHDIPLYVSSKLVRFFRAGSRFF
jgi:hypothetical protein